MSILDRLEEEAVKAKQTLEGYWLFELLRDAQTEIKRLESERTEFICRKCFLRQDNPNQKKASF